MKSLLASTSENAIVVVSLDGAVLAWLGAAELLFGYESDEAVGMPLSRVFTPEDVAGQLDRQERELALSAGRSEDDRWHVRKDGSRFWGSGVMEPVFEDDGTVVALAKVVRDRTDVRARVVALESRMQAAEQQNLARLEALASVSHELRNQVTPLVNLVGALERLSAAPSVTAGMRRQLQVMGRLLDDLAQAAAVMADKPAISVTSFEVQDALAQAVAGLQALAEQRGQLLKVTVPDAPIVIEADAQRVNQILVNLLGNASKFTPAGGTIQLSATVEENMVAIRVEDDGAGIGPEVLPRIFDLFTREQRASAPEGLGVGLSVVKNLAEVHGGFVEGRSPGPGKGSVFTVRLPLRQRALDPQA
jgi:PAS domain S-box-containing protein